MTLRRALADLRLCEHEVERLRAQRQADLATIRRLKARVRELEQALARRRRRPAV